MSEVLASDGGEEVLQGLEANISAVLSEGVRGGGDVMESIWEEVLARIPAESSTPMAGELGVMVVAQVAMLASVFSPDILPYLKGFHVASCACVLPQV